MFMVLSSWQSHCESSPGSFDECRMAPSGRRPKTKPDNLGCESACSVQAAMNYTHHLMDAGCRQLCDTAASITFCFGLRSEQYFLWSYCIVCSSRCLVRRVVCSSYCVVCSSYCLVRSVVCSSYCVVCSSRCLVRCVVCSSYCVVCSSRCLVRRVVCSSYCVVCSSYCCLVFSTLLRSE